MFAMLNHVSDLPAHPILSRAFGIFVSGRGPNYVHSWPASSHAACSSLPGDSKKARRQQGMALHCCMRLIRKQRVHIRYNPNAPRDISTQHHTRRMRQMSCHGHTTQWQHRTQVRYQRTVEDYLRPASLLLLPLPTGHRLLHLLPILSEQPDSRAYPRASRPSQLQCQHDVQNRLSPGASHRLQVS